MSATTPPGGGDAAAGDATRRAGWETMLRNLDAHAVLAEAAVYAAGKRRLTVDHGEPLNDAGAELLSRLVHEVAQVVEDAGPHCTANMTGRPASLTWTFQAPDGQTRDLVLAARTVIDRLDPGGWVVTADDHL